MGSLMVSNPGEGQSISSGKCAFRTVFHLFFLILLPYLQLSAFFSWLLGVQMLFSGISNIPPLMLDL